MMSLIQQGVFDMTTTKDLARNTAFVVTYGDEITVRSRDVAQLAIAYHQFMEAATAGRLVDAKKWAVRLAGAQETVGVTLISDRMIADYL
jgi:hypothetical protein